MKTLNRSFWARLAPYGVFFVLTLLWHMDLVLVDVDEAFYGAVIGQQPLWEFLVRQYESWSSRTVIELFLCIFSSLPRLVWRLADSAVLLLLAVCLGRLAGGPAPGRPLRPRDTWLLVCLLWLYPWWYLSTAGWVATTMNYLWPLAGLCLAFVSLAGYGGRWGAVLGLIGPVYAVNAEQTAVLALLLLAAWALYRLGTGQPLPRLFFGQAAVCLAVLLSGFATRCAIGFTPASAVSGERTGFLLAMSVAVCGVLLGQKLRLTRLWQKVLAALILLPMAGIQFVSLWEI